MRCDWSQLVNFTMPSRDLLDGHRQLVGLVLKGAMLTELNCFQFTGDIMPHAVSIGSGVAI